MKKTTRRILSGLLLAVFLVSSGLLIRNFLEFRAGEESYEAARTIAAAAPAAPGPTREAETQPTRPETKWVPAPMGEDPEAEELRKMDLEALRQVNPDVTGWIRIPGTVVDYPLVQGRDNEFYLDHNWQGDAHYVGSIFLEQYNAADLTDFHTLVYGHNMADGSMFGSLHRYQWEAHWREHPYVYILTDAGVLRYEVFATYTTQTDSDTYALSFPEEANRTAYIAGALEQSLLDLGIRPEPTDRILTLSTCGGLGHTARRVVHARLPMMEAE